MHTKKKILKKFGFVEILSDFYKKFFKNIFLVYFYFNFQRIILESVFLFYTLNFTSIKKNEQYIVIYSKMENKYYYEARKYLFSS